MNVAPLRETRLASTTGETGSVGPMDQDTLELTTPASDSATVAFIDLAGFSAITDVYGDSAALAMLDIFEGMVRSALEDHAPPVDWRRGHALFS